MRKIFQKLTERVSVVSGQGISSRRGMVKG